MPRAGDIVLYNLCENDVKRVEARLNRFGNPVDIYVTYPMLIVHVWGDTPQAAVNGIVFLDGEDALWVTSVCQKGAVPDRVSIASTFQYR